jgi:hypothetical protein
MPNPSFLGYLTEPYLEDPYSGDTGLYAFGFEVELKILDKQKPIGYEVERQIVDSKNVKGFEVERQINQEEPKGFEVFREISVGETIGFEVQREILDRKKPIATEVTLEVQEQKPKGYEVARFMKDILKPTAFEVQRVIQDQLKPLAFEIKRNFSVAHWQCEDLGYLNQPYLGGDYLTGGFCAQMGWEVARLIKKYDPRGFEVERIITADNAFGTEVELKIADFPKPIGFEIDRLKSRNLGMQVRLVLYNTNRLRILCDFPSRGVSGLNWGSTSTEAGDFSPNNLNTDIVEQVWRSQTGTLSVVLTCDTEVPQGVVIDTLAMLNHNLTTSATITIEGSMNPSFAPVNQSIAIETKNLNNYYIAPLFPTTQSRYYRFIISDTTNPNNFLQIGTIVFGSAIIFQGESFVDTVTRKRRHFSDKVETEGFTNVSNDRALKRAIGLEFRFLRYQKGNYKNMNEIFEYARTSLKCLWIPDPQETDRFSVFGKLVQIPDEVHRDYGHESNDTVDFNLDIDESL